MEDVHIPFVFLSRYDSHSGGEREIQRTMLELLNQLDGFDSRGDVKVCTSYVHIAGWSPASAISLPLDLLQAQMSIPVQNYSIQPLIFRSKEN